MKTMIWIYVTSYTGYAAQLSILNVIECEKEFNSLNVWIYSALLYKQT